MGTLTSFFGGGGGVILPEPIFLFDKSSATYTFPYDGTVLVHVIGAGGSGSKQFNSYQATGGGAGGYSRKEFSVTAGNTATVTTGTGGAGVGYNIADAQGVDGTASSFVFGASTLTANGGSGGNRYLTDGGAGGTATGGDVNYTGGRGGNTYSSYGVLLNIGTGGGAVNFFNKDTHGGDVTTNTYIKSGTGGGGIGGSGGTIDSTGVSGYYVPTGGGGTGGRAPAVSETGKHYYSSLDGGPGGAVLFGKSWYGVGVPGTWHWGAGYDARDYATSYFLMAEFGAGGGGGAKARVGGTFYFKLNPAGMFGGGGGAGGDTNGAIIAGSAIVGGGGGGATSTETSGTNVVSGSGGNGCIVIEYTAVA